jgi:C_GCAxxG_C_C family probable redox protein
MIRSIKAANKFLDEYACSQAILTEYCDQYGLDHTLALKLASGFAGGMRMGKTCGAVTGAYMVLGLNFGGFDCHQIEGRKRVYRAVCDFTRKFEELYGSVNCMDLLGYDIRTEQGMQAVREQNLFRTVCPEFVKASAKLLDQLIVKS